jgi:fucokinase
MKGFNYLIVTAPNEYLCDIYQLQLNHLCQYLESFAKISGCLCIADPAGVRIGSGGGTLNALSKLIEKVGENEVIHSKIAIIHSGGDSRRSPLQSVVGKAWTHINSAIADDGAPSTPLSLLIQELNIVAENMSQGSLVIASSDVLVSLSSVQGPYSSSHGLPQDQPFPQLPENGITVITVSETLAIARNHVCFLSFPFPLVDLIISGCLGRTYQF